MGSRSPDSKLQRNKLCNNRNKQNEFIWCRIYCWKSCGCCNYYLIKRNLSRGSQNENGGIQLKLEAIGVIGLTSDFMTLRPL